MEGEFSDDSLDKLRVGEVSLGGGAVCHGPTSFNS